MSDNLQAIPLGLVGFKDVTYNTIVYEGGVDYDVQNTDQVIIMINTYNVVFDTSIISNYKMFIIKNLSGNDIDIDPDDAFIDGVAGNITLANNECIELLYFLMEAGKNFAIISRYT